MNYFLLKLILSLFFFTTSFFVYHKVKKEPYFKNIKRIILLLIGSIVLAFIVSHQIYKYSVNKTIDYVETGDLEPDLTTMALADDSSPLLKLAIDYNKRQNIIGDWAGQVNDENSTYNYMFHFDSTDTFKTSLNIKDTSFYYNFDIFEKKLDLIKHSQSIEGIYTVTSNDINNGVDLIEHIALNSSSSIYIKFNSKDSLKMSIDYQGVELIMSRK